MGIQPVRIPGEEGIEDHHLENHLRICFSLGSLTSRATWLVCLKYYAADPDQMTWWIRVLLNRPGGHSQGIGQTVVQGFMDYMRLSGGQVIMLGVVDENTLAYKDSGAGWGSSLSARQSPANLQNKTLPCLLCVYKFESPDIHGANHNYTSNFDPRTPQYRGIQFSPHAWRRRCRNPLCCPYWAFGPTMAWIPKPQKEDGMYRKDAP